MGRSTTGGRVVLRREEGGREGGGRERNEGTQRDSEMERDLRDKAGEQK